MVNKIRHKYIGVLGKINHKGNHKHVDKSTVSRRVVLIYLNTLDDNLMTVLKEDNIYQRNHTITNKENKHWRNHKSTLNPLCQGHTSAEAITTHNTKTDVNSHTHSDVKHVTASQ